jgi:energy-coupling factor transporter ATP-binding protein EcfA2
VRDLSFDIRQGGITGLIGPNGSGKTTVLNLITGELRPDRGAILLEGEDISGWPAFRICRARIARTFQLVRVLPYMTAQENVMLGRMFGTRRFCPPGRRTKRRRCSSAWGMPGSGFFHPYARSVPTQPATPMPTQPAAAAAESARPPAPARTESIPTSGGFVNPNARPAKQ